MGKRLNKVQGRMDLAELDAINFDVIVAMADTIRE